MLRHPKSGNELIKYLNAEGGKPDEIPSEIQVEHSNKTERG